jgi:hypothetical protein
MILFSVWKYIDKIPDINNDKIEGIFKSMFNQYQTALKEFSKYKKIKNKEAKKKFMESIDTTMLGVYLRNYAITGNVTTKASFKDDLGIEHSIEFKNIHYSSKLIRFCRQYLGKRIQVYCVSIVVDGKSIIDMKTGEFIKPEYFNRVQTFKDEIGITS